MNGVIEWDGVRVLVRTNRELQRNAVREIFQRVGCEWVFLSEVDRGFR